MRDEDCVEFLRWALPRLRMRWAGFRKVRGQVCKRIARRIDALQLGDAAIYRHYLDSHPAEWTELDRLCRVTISRFYRDRGCFDHLRDELLAELARGVSEANETQLRCWSVGCASGEEPYTLALIWQLALRSRFPDLALRIVATDVDERLLQRGRDAIYTDSSLKELPAEWVVRGFVLSGKGHAVVEPVRRHVRFVEQDARLKRPAGPFHLILCRNFVFTYYEEALQREILERFESSCLPGGALVIGAHESLPPGSDAFTPRASFRGLYSRSA
jgi:chemotaxis protein methyltransferase CheR